MPRDDVRSHPVHLSRFAGEVETRSVEGEGRAAQTVRAARPAPRAASIRFAALIRFAAQSREAGEV
jgi:hypothetical protein